MSTFGDATAEDVLAEEILETIRSFYWHEFTWNIAIRALVLVLNYITEYQDLDENIKG